MKKYGITREFSIPLFLAVDVNDERQCITFAMYAPVPLTPDTIAAEWAFGALRCMSPRGDCVLELMDKQEFKPSQLSEYLAPKEISDHMNIYFCMEPTGMFVRPFNKMMESFDGKEPGGMFLQRTRQSCFAQLLIPHPQALWSEMALRVTVHAQAGHWLNFGSAPVTVDNTNEAYSQFAADVMPSIEAVVRKTCSDADQVTDIEFRVVPPRAGARVFVKSDAGYLTRTEYITDEQGKVSARFSTRDLPAGEVATVEAGFKWVSNMARTQVEVTA